MLRFPFGEPITPVRQADRSPKRVFILGVYASAVHARWVGPDGATLVTALAVASEPRIFWTGDGAAEIIGAIDVPAEVGALVPASASLNGPSGRALDRHYLSPLGLSRTDAWLCDLLPESRLNPNQVSALTRAGYPELAKRGLVPSVDLSAASVPVVFMTSDRPTEILSEIAAARPDILITLGDQPIADFVGPHAGIPGRTLGAFGTDPDRYGRLHPITLGDKQAHALAAAGASPPSRCIGQGIIPLDRIACRMGVGGCTGANVDPVHLTQPLRGQLPYLPDRRIPLHPGHEALVSQRLPARLPTVLDPRDAVPGAPPASAMDVWSSTHRARSRKQSWSIP